MRLRSFFVWCGLVAVTFAMALHGHSFVPTSTSDPARAAHVAGTPSTVAPAAASGLFGSPTTYSAGTNPHAVAIADVNGDGKNDLVVTNSHSNPYSVSVLLGNGNGTFGSAANFTTGTKPKFVALDHLNPGGALDLVSANQDANTVSVLLGTGTGSFGAKTDYPVCARPHEVATGDFNGDGKRDLAVACWDGSVISILLGNGNGTFGGKNDFTTGSSPHSLVVGRFNADVHDDLAVANHGSDTIGVLLGNGTGTFSAAVAYDVGARPHSVRAGDFNKDGKTDLVSANDGSDTVSVLLGTGTGTFAAAVSFAVGLVPKSVAVADLNGDGRLDLITANTAGNGEDASGIPNGDNVSVLLGTGTGSFGAASTDDVGPTPFSVVTGLLNADSKPDVATANWDGNSVTVLLNTSGGNPPPDTTRPTILETSPADGASEVTVGTDVMATFSEAMSASTLSGATVTLVNQATSTSVPASVSYDSSSRVVTLDPDGALAGGTTYLARIRGGTSGVKDPAGNALLADSTWTFTTSTVPDTTPPDVASPTMRVVVPSTVGSTTVSIRLTWTATDAESGIASFQIVRGVDGGPLTALAPTIGSSSRSFVTPVAPGHGYVFAVRATDAAGNVALSLPTSSIRPVIYQETTPLATYSGTWSSQRAPLFLGGRSRTSSRVGAKLTFSFTGRAVAWVAPKGSRMGSAKVYVDGVYRGTVRLYSVTSRNRQAVFEYAWSTAGRHTLRVVLAGPSSRPRVDVDALLVVR